MSQQLSKDSRQHQETEERASQIKRLATLAIDAYKVHKSTKPIAATDNKEDNNHKGGSSV